MLFCLDIDDDDQSEKRRNLDIIYKFMNAACITALFCSCTLESENEKEVDNENDIYFGNDSQIIHKSGMVTYTEIKKATGAVSGLTLQVQRILKSMERPYSTNGLKVVVLPTSRRRLLDDEILRLKVCRISYVQWTSSGRLLIVQHQQIIVL